MVHRDSLGSLQPIRPGDINWMTAGRGIVHSERTGPGAARVRLHRARHPAVGGTAARRRGDRARVSPPPGGHAAGAARSRASTSACWSARRSAAARRWRRSRGWPTSTSSMEAGASIELPDDVADRGAYLVDGEVTCGAERCAALAHAASSVPGTARACAPSARAASCCSPAIAFPSRVTSGGTSSPARRSASSRRSATGASGAARPTGRSRSCPATSTSSSRCPRA